MQNVHPVSRTIHHVRTSTDITTQVVTINPRHVALHHLTRFAKLSIVVAATIIAVLYTVTLIIGLPILSL